MSFFAAIRIFLLFVSVFLIITPIQAEQFPIKKLSLPQGDVVEAKEYPWSTVGKLNNGAGGSCTAVLISQDYAVTAAHCLYYRNLARFLPAQSFHLILGYENQQFQDHLRIAAYHVPPTYNPLKPYETLASDWALLSIAGHRAVSTRLLDFSRHFDLDNRITLNNPTTLMTAGYSHRTPYAMTADRNCRLIGRSHDNSFIYDSCKAPAGYSGAPVLVSTAHKRTVSVAGIHVANQVWQGQAIAIAIPIETIWRQIKPCVEDHQCNFQIVATGKDQTAAEVLSGLPNLGYKNQIRLTDSSQCSINDTRC